MTGMKLKHSFKRKMPGHRGSAVKQQMSARNRTCVTNSTNQDLNLTIGFVCIIGDHPGFPCFLNAMETFGLDFCRSGGLTAPSAAFESLFWTELLRGFLLGIAGVEVPGLGG
jgi:hypothetical protein